MKTTVKKWAFNLVLLSLMASCGGDNNATGGGGTVSDNDNLNNGVSSATGTATYSGFISKVENAQFEGQSADLDFFYEKTSSGSNNSNCDTLWGFIEYCSYSSSGPVSGNYRVRGIDHNGDVIYREGLDGIDTFGDSLSEIHSRLVSRMKGASTAYKCLNLGHGEQCYTESEWRRRYLARNSYGQKVYFFSEDPRLAKSNRWIFKSGDFTYLVDLKRPLGAQPVGIMKDGEIYNSYY